MAREQEAAEECIILLFYYKITITRDFQKVQHLSSIFIL